MEELLERLRGQKKVGRWRDPEEQLRREKAREGLRPEKLAKFNPPSFFRV